MTTSVEATAVRSAPPELIRRPARPAPVLRTILVAIGLLSKDEPAVRVAAALAAATSAELVLVGIAPVVLPDPEPAVDHDAPWGRDYRDEQELMDQMVRDHLCEVVERLPASVRTRTVLDWGSRAGALLHCCQEQHPDLVVVSHIEGGPLRRVLYNHATRAIIRHLEAPVLVVPIAR
jgi:nucleotide-binding universal stress UspA family protein